MRHEVRNGPAVGRRRLNCVPSCRAAGVALLHGLCLILLAGAASCAPRAAPQPKPPTDGGLSQRIEAMKVDVVERLAQCESGGQSIHSPNGLYVGPMQFHLGTVVGYYRSLYGQQISTREASAIALDKPRATQLAKDIIFTSGNKARDWPHCNRKLGLSREVDQILAMEQ